MLLWDLSMSFEMVCHLYEIVGKTVEINSFGGGCPSKMIMILLLVSHFMPNKSPTRAALLEYSLHQRRIITCQYLVLVYRYFPVRVWKLWHGDDRIYRLLRLEERLVLCLFLQRSSLHIDYHGLGYRRIILIQECELWLSFRWLLRSGTRFNNEVIDLHVLIMEIVSQKPFLVVRPRRRFIDLDWHQRWGCNQLIRLLITFVCIRMWATVMPHLSLGYGVLSQPDLLLL